MRKGSLKDFPLVDLTASIVAEVINRAVVDAFKIWTGGDRQCDSH